MRVDHGEVMSDPFDMVELMSWRSRVASPFVSLYRTVRASRPRLDRLTFLLAWFIPTWIAIVWWGFGEGYEMGAVGDALSPVGVAVTALAFIFGFSNRHEDSQRAHEDALRAHDDRLAVAYSEWFSEVWGATVAQFERVIDAQLRVESGMSVALRKNEPPLYEETLAVYRKLVIAAARLLMTERRPEFVERIRKTYAFPEAFHDLDSWDDNQAVSQWLGRVGADMRRKSDSFEQILADVSECRLPALSNAKTITG